MDEGGSATGTAPQARSESFDEAMRVLHDIAIARALGHDDAADLAPLLQGRLAMRTQTLDLALDTATRDDAVAVLTHGWRPSELLAYARRRLDPVASAYLLDVLAATARWPGTVSWAADLAALGARVWWSWDEPHLRQWALRHGHRRIDAVRAAVDVLALLRYLPRADPLASAS